ncbi:MAG TPA: glycosyltransferase family 39 protein [Methylomirabilota bacterium]|nr:glycosyltransferase family 39 protein [Methylomirabilota bacterium]
MKLKLSTKFILFVILLFAGALRLYDSNWDQGYHLHPDERAIILTTTKLHLPQILSQFLSPDSTWNPHFFAYGSFPFYFLYFVGQSLTAINPDFAQYVLINIPGRFISAVSDLLTLVLLFALGRKLFGKTIGLLAAFFYGISVLPIQLSHFYAVDTLLTLFIVATLYQLIRFYEKPSLSKALTVGIFFGFALATKVSALVLLISLGAALSADFLLLFLKQPHKPEHYLPYIPSFLKHLLTHALLIGGVTFGTFLILEPYALIDFPNFWMQTVQQSAMTHDAFTFPYTLQYVGKIPYFYELKNIFFFGLGPMLGVLAFIGFFLFTNLTLRKGKKGKWAQEIILLVFFAAYFFTVGKFAIGFMRYMLPLYPLCCLFAALSTFTLIQLMNQLLKNIFLRSALSIILFILLLLWPMSFMHIYSKPNTRVSASFWIHQNIPVGKTLTVEHWDDQLPLTDSQEYQTQTLALYDPDTDLKWQIINKQLEQTDDIIIASNRLYTPLQKLTNCTKLPPDRCYQRTALYYQSLFSGKLGFQKVAEFTDYPVIPFLNIPINDQWADESFTVYDHPRVMIFKKYEN